MPHQRIHSLDQDPDHTNNVQIAWGPPPSPSDTGPGHGNDDGHVMIIVERPGTPARTACSIDEVRRQLASRVQVALAANGMTAATNPADVEKMADEVIKTIGLEELTYAFGSPLERLAVMIDRKGCNEVIAAVRRGRNAAFGKDE